jgi:hypothetical protein
MQAAIFLYTPRRQQYRSLKKNYVRPELVEGLWLRGWWFDKLTTNG